MHEVTAALGALRIVPVVVLESAADAAPLARALKAGGLPCAEVTFRTSAGLESLRVLARDADLLVGAGTVLRPEQVDHAVEAGARFIVCPGFSRAVVERCQSRGVPVYPGVATPTELQMALDAGIEVVKFFPAEAFGGVDALRAIAAPFPMVRFIPTGGITSRNLGEYLGLQQVVAVGGSWMVAPPLIAAGNFDEITRLTRDAVSMASALRGP